MFKVAVVTGTRAEYGLLRPVIQKLFSNKEIAPALLVTGTHLAPQYGNTIAEIEADGFPIAARLDILSAMVPEGRVGTAMRTALALRLFCEYFAEEENRPDALLVLGDRYEILAAAEAAALLDIPVVHISGGDVTHGADDDWFRHCITKMAKLHFPSCEVYRQRVIRMGEAPNWVFNVGGLGDENIRNMPLLGRRELAESLGLELPDPFVLVTLHPETATGLPVRAQAEALFTAMEQNTQMFYLLTKANADAGGAELNAYMEQFCMTHDNAVLFASLGSLRYLSAMKWAALVLGNSSSGVVETPSFGTPAVDIGERQAGRVTGINLLHCTWEARAIAEAMHRALAPAFRMKAEQSPSPYNGGDTSGKIVSNLLKCLKAGTLQKPKVFYDGEPHI